jgi:hypothetical protein
MNEKINVGELTVQEFNLVMKAISAQPLGEVLELFMRLRQLAVEFEAAKAPSQAGGV